MYLTQVLVKWLVKTRDVVMNKYQAFELVKQFHAGPLGGHTGMNKNEDAISTRFSSRAMHNDIRKRVRYTALPLLPNLYNVLDGTIIDTKICSGQWPLFH